MPPRPFRCPCVAAQRAPPPLPYGLGVGAQRFSCRRNAALMHARLAANERGAMVGVAHAPIDPHAPSQMETLARAANTLPDRSSGQLAIEAIERQGDRDA